MMYYYEKDYLFNSKADALVNPVNCKGTMGKGIAKEFKKRFPECFAPYKRACDEGKLSPGNLLFVKLKIQPDLFGSKRPGVILFATKNHWRTKSRIDWINNGLVYLKSHYKEWGLKSIGMPQIGCGLGGLEWESVKTLIEKYFKDEPIELKVYLNAIYEYNEKTNHK